MTAADGQWDIVTGVGLTALAVAAARALVTDSPDGLVDDPFAAEFVRAANPPRPMPTTVAEADGDAMWTGMSQYIGLRSDFFDRAVTGTDASQVVILAAGLDARAYRLDLAGRDVYEVDQPLVLDFKQSVLDGVDAKPRCDRHPVPADLREDWPTALRQAGFDPARPTVWLAEGLLPYLPGKAEEDLFDTIVALSAPGSRVAIEQVHQGDDEEVEKATREFDSAKRLGVEVADLLPRDPRRDPVEWLRGHGWSVSVRTAADLAADHGRALPALLSGTLGPAKLSVADLPG